MAVDWKHFCENMEQHQHLSNHSNLRCRYNRKCSERKFGISSNHCRNSQPFEYWPKLEQTLRRWHTRNSSNLVFYAQPLRLYQGEHTRSVLSTSSQSSTDSTEKEMENCSKSVLLIFSTKPISRGGRAWSAVVINQGFINISIYTLIDIKNKHKFVFGV